MTNVKNKRGGAREGAGRPNIKGKTERIACRLPVNMVEFLKRDSGTITESVEKAITLYMNKGEDNV